VLATREVVVTTDKELREQAVRRTRLYIVVVAIVLVPACAYFGITQVYRDTCTRSYDREPDLVVASFVEMVLQGDYLGLTGCWSNLAFYDLNAGCSDICLQRILGAEFHGIEMQAGEPFRTDKGRSNVLVQVAARCHADGDPRTGIITLDSVGTNLPWKHWKIVQSTFGGTATEPWCR
jgi:hypothetical protein